MVVRNALFASVARNFGSKRVDMPVQIRTNSNRATLGCPIFSFADFSCAFLCFLSYCLLVLAVVASGSRFMQKNYGIDRWDSARWMCLPCERLSRFFLLNSLLFDILSRGICGPWLPSWGFCKTRCARWSFQIRELFSFLSSLLTLACRRFSEAAFSLH